MTSSHSDFLSVFFYVNFFLKCDFVTATEQIVFWRNDWFCYAWEGNGIQYTEIGLRTVPENIFSQKSAMPVSLSLSSFFNLWVIEASSPLSQTIQSKDFCRPETVRQWQVYTIQPNDKTLRSPASSMWCVDPLTERNSPKPDSSKWHFLVSKHTANLATHRRGVRPNWPLLVRYHEKELNDTTAGANIWGTVTNLCSCSLAGTAQVSCQHDFLIF